MPAHMLMPKLASLYHSLYSSIIKRIIAALIFPPQIAESWTCISAFRCNLSPSEHWIELLSRHNYPPSALRHRTTATTTTIIRTLEDTTTVFMNSILNAGRHNYSKHQLLDISKPGEQLYTQYMPQLQHWKTPAMISWRTEWVCLIQLLKIEIHNIKKNEVWWFMQPKDSSEKLQILRNEIFITLLSKSIASVSSYLIYNKTLDLLILRYWLPQYKMITTKKQ